MPMINRLAEILESRQITKYRVYRDSGVSKQTIYNMVNDSAYLPDGRTISSLCDYLMISPDELLLWTPPQEMINSESE